MLYPLLFIRGGRAIRTMITLLCIWSFCFLAGREASVLRAGIMFSSIHAGRWLERPVSGMQALGVSMLLLLIADSDWIFDPGFQLSHGAVGGILLIQPTLTKAAPLKNPLLKHVWGSISMTLAATLGTLPFSAYYFHQFPALFLPANLIAVPLSSLALVVLFILIPVSPFPVLANPTVWLLHHILNGMNGWVERLDRIPGTVWTW